MIEAEIESALATKFAALGLTDCGITSAWTMSAAEEDATKTAYLAVSVSPRQYDQFMTPVANFAVSLAFTAKVERCPSGSDFAILAGKIMAKLESWQADVTTVQTDLATTHFEPAGFQLNGGGAPSLDRARALWIVNFDFTVRGVCSAAATTNTTTNN